MAEANKPGMVRISASGKQTLAGLLVPQYLSFAHLRLLSPSALTHPHQGILFLFYLFLKFQLIPKETSGDSIPVSLYPISDPHNQ